MRVGFYETEDITESRPHAHYQTYYQVMFDPETNETTVKVDRTEMTDSGVITKVSKTVTGTLPEQ